MDSFDELYARYLMLREEADERLKRMTELMHRAEDLYSENQRLWAYVGIVDEEISMCAWDSNAMHEMIGEIRLARERLDQECLDVLRD